MEPQCTFRRKGDGRRGGNGEPGRNRTCDPRIKSALLYQLSYGPTLFLIYHRRETQLTPLDPALEFVYLSCQFCWVGISREPGAPGLAGFETRARRRPTPASSFSGVRTAQRGNRDVKQNTVLWSGRGRFPSCRAALCIIDHDKRIANCRAEFVELNSDLPGRVRLDSQQLGNSALWFHG